MMAACNQNSKRRPCTVSVFTSSALCLGFNNLWCQALCSRLSHNIELSVMFHADIVPSAYCIDTMLDVMEETGASVVSVASPIKDDRGIFSTAIDDPNDPWAPLFRVTAAQLAELPDVFTAADLGHPDKALLVNTGCWLAKITEPWARQFALERDSTGQSGFNTLDCIEEDENGRLFPRFQPEDWRFSRWLHRHKIPYVCTKRVVLTHVGSYRFRNDQVWGQERDHLSKETPAKALGELADELGSRVSYPGSEPEKAAEPAAVAV